MERLMPLLVFAGVVMLICLALVVWVRLQKSQVVLRAVTAETCRCPIRGSKSGHRSTVESVSRAWET